ncbi:amidohydrolase family protein [Zobellella maritima]|uniref:amidohydrolase family protein n=1 Tax=Zobellella maritima TaxID=2059725 RepID=UPI0013009848|nr:amidohydrolase family protein [Zobellella maritima]
MHQTHEANHEHHDAAVHSPTALLPLVDSHHHLWQLDALDYKWLKDEGALKPFGDPTPIQRDYLIEEYRRDIASQHVIKSVHVQADGAITDPVTETAWLQAIADRHPDPFPHAIVGYANLDDASAEDVLQRHCQHRNMRGIRQILSHHPDSRLSFTAKEYLDSPTWRHNFAKLAPLGLSFDLQLYPHQMQQAARFLEQHPDVPVVIDHAGSPWDQSPVGLAAWKYSLSLLAELEQVYVKMSGLGMFDRHWNEQRLSFVTDTLLELFGSKRVMVGSNFPVDSLSASYDQVMESYRRQLLQLSTDEQTNILAANAERFYRI